MEVEVEVGGVGGRRAIRAGCGGLKRVGMGENVVGEGKLEWLISNKWACVYLGGL